MKVPFYVHNIGDEEIQKIAEVLKSPFLTTGSVTGELEQKLSEYMGGQHAVGISNCTTGLFICLKALGIGEGDEVITTPMTFIATSNVVLHAGAKVRFVDAEKVSGNIDTEKIVEAITPETKALMPVHLYGQMVDMKRLQEIARAHNLYVIEDAAHALESERDGIKPGQLSKAACLSFYATKNITSGEGGAMVTTDEELAETFKKMRMHGMSKGAADRYSAERYQHWDMELLGYKCNMKDPDAALLLPQIEKAEDRLKRREEICQQYEKAFSEAGIEFPKVVPGSKSGRHLFTIWVNPERRDEIVWKIQEKGVGAAVNYRAVHLLKYYRETFGYKSGDFPVAEEIGNRTITLPLYPKLTDEQVDYVIGVVKEAVK